MYIEFIYPQNIWYVHSILIEMVKPQLECDISQSEYDTSIDAINCPYCLACIGPQDVSDCMFKSLSCADDESLLRLVVELQATKRQLQQFLSYLSDIEKNQIKITSEKIWAIELRIEFTAMIWLKQNSWCDELTLNADQDRYIV